LQADAAGARDPNRVCYAAKEHPGFAPIGSMLFTYVCNLVTRPGEDPWIILQRLQRDMTIYRPRVVVLPVPPEAVEAVKETEEAQPREK